MLEFEKCQKSFYFTDTLNREILEIKIKMKGSPYLF